MRTKKRKPVVVDTNVPIIANQRDAESLQCVAACAEALNNITKNGLLVLDDGNRIFNEYKCHLSFSGQPGAGDVFFKWLSDNRYRPDRVAQVSLVEDPAREGEFVTFPDDPALASFDHSDRKFVAVALAHPERPPVLNATDSDWWNYRDALRAYGITVTFVCGEGRFRGE